MSVRRKLGKLRRLSLHDRAWLAQAWLLLLVADLALRILPFARVRRLFERREAARNRSVSASERAVAEHALELVGIAARNHLYAMGCLRQVLVASPLLRRQGVPSMIRVGVKREGGALLAHAWLEIDGRPVGEDLGWLKGFSPLEGQQ